MRDFEWKIIEAGSVSRPELRLKLAGGAWQTHYMLVFVPAVLASFYLAMLFLLPRDPNTQRLLGCLTLILVPLALLFLRAKRNDLRFKCYATGNDPISNCNVIRALAEFHRWEVLRDDEGSLLHIGIPSSSVFSMTKGEAITVLFKGSDVFVNCIPWPEGRSSALASWSPAKQRVLALVTAVDGKMV